MRPSWFPPARSAMSRAATTRMHGYYEVRVGAARYERAVAKLQHDQVALAERLADALQRGDRVQATVIGLQQLELRMRADALASSGEGARVAKEIDALIIRVAQVPLHRATCTRAVGRARARARARRRRCSASRGSRSSGDDGDGGDKADGSHGLLAGGRR